MDKIKNKKYFNFFMLGIIIGGIVGIVVINFLISYRIDEYHKKIEYLKTVIEEKNDSLDKLEQSRNKRKFVVKDIEIILNLEGDEFEKITIKKHIRQKFNSLLGKEVKEIEPELLWEIVNKRIMKVDKNEYKLKVNKILISDIVKVWVEGSLISVL